MECEGFVSAVENELLQSSVSVEAMAGRKAQDAVVFVFDRRCDPVTPLLNQWTYQGRSLNTFLSRGEFRWRSPDVSEIFQWHFV